MSRLKRLKKIRLHREGTHTLWGGLLLLLAVNSALAVSLVIFALSAYLVLRRKTHPVLIIVMGAALGIAAGYMGLIPG